MKSFQHLSPSLRTVFIHLMLSIFAGIFVIGNLLSEPSQTGGFLGFSSGRWVIFFINLLVLTSLCFFIYKVGKNQSGVLETWLNSERNLFWIFFFAIFLLGFSLPAGLGKIPAIRYFAYFGRLRPTLLWIAFVSGMIFLNLLVVLRKSILNWFRQFFPFDDPAQETTLLTKTQRFALLGIALFYVLLQFISFLQVREAIWLPDSIDYIFPAERYAWNELGLWTHTKPWGAAVLYKVVGSSPVTIDVVQTLLSTLAWIALAWTFSQTIKSHWLRITSVVLILGFSLAPSVQMWNHIIQSESLSISLMILILAIWLSLLRNWCWNKLFVLIFLFGWWIGSRETNVYLSLMIAGVLVLVGFIYKHQRFYWAVSAILIGFCIVNMQISEIPTLPRWLYPLTNTLLNRILPNEEFLGYFQGHGLPTPPELTALSGGLATSGDFAVYNDPALNDVEEWLYRKGKDVYIQFLLSHPIYTLTAPWLNLNEILAPNNVQTYAPKLINPALVGIFGIFFFLNSLLGLAFLAIITIITVLKAAPWKKSAFWVFLVSLGLFFPHFYLVWHGDAAEIGRHAIQASVQLRLTLWLLFLLALDTIVRNDYPIRTHNRS